MYARTKTFKNKDGSTRTYLQICETKREDGKVRQIVVANLGRLEELQEGALDKLVASLGKYCKMAKVIRSMDELNTQWSKELGPVVIFRRLWEQLELPDLLNKYIADTQIQRPVESAIFAMVLNRLVDPDSKLAVSKWVDTVYYPDFKQLELHHYYRGLDFLHEHQHEIENFLWNRVRNLFNQKVDLVFFDTTSTYFEGNGPSNIAKKGYSKDKRPDRNQVIVGALMTSEGIPIAHQVFPGNTADVNAFITALDDLKNRFSIGKVIIAADRGMVSNNTLQALRDHNYQFIVGVKMRKLKKARDLLTRAGRYRLVKPNLKVKELGSWGDRYIICLNPEEAKRHKLIREAILEKLRKTLKTSGPKTIVGNRGYQRYLKIDKEAVTINEDVIKQEAIYDGKYLLRTNCNLPPAEVALAYKGLWQVERIFRTMKSSLDLRPIYHWKEERVRGHIFICFLAFVLQVMLAKLLKDSKHRFKDLMLDLRKLHAVKFTIGQEEFILRTELKGNIFDIFKAVGSRPPKRILGYKSTI